MNIFLTLAFLFFIGATLGWVLELLFRRFFSSANPERKWINPGFCVGPYLPLYGCGLCFLYLIASLEQFSIIRDPFWNRVVLFLIMAVCMTVTGIFRRSHRPQGLPCPPVGLQQAVGQHSGPHLPEILAGVGPSRRRILLPDPSAHPARH